MAETKTSHQGMRMLHELMGKDIEQLLAMDTPLFERRQMVSDLKVLCGRLNKRINTASYLLSGGSPTQTETAKRALACLFMLVNDNDWGRVPPQAFTVDDLHSLWLMPPAPGYRHRHREEFHAIEQHCGVSGAQEIDRDTLSLMLFSLYHHYPGGEYRLVRYDAKRTDPLYDVERRPPSGWRSDQIPDHQRER